LLFIVHVNEAQEHNI